MAIDDVRRFFAERDAGYSIIEFTQSSATVDLAAAALGVEPALIAKTLALWAGDHPVIVVARGDARLDNRKFKDRFRAKPKMLGPSEVLEVTGHAVGGVCPFGLRTAVPVFLDVSLREFEVVYPAGGAENTAVRMTPNALQELTGGTWIDVCRTDSSDAADRVPA